MFCTKCGEKLQPEDDFCGNCGSAASSLSPPAFESDEKSTRLKFIVVLWAFMYAFVGTAVVLFVFASLVGDNLGYKEASWWLDENLIIISAIVGAFNALTRGITAARTR